MILLDKSPQMKKPDRPPVLNKDYNVGRPIFTLGFSVHDNYRSESCITAIKRESKVKTFHLFKKYNSLPEVYLDWMMDLVCNVLFM